MSWGGWWNLMVPGLDKECQTQDKKQSQQSQACTNTKTHGTKIKVKTPKTGSMTYIEREDIHIHFSLRWNRITKWKVFPLMQPNQH